MQKFTAVSNFTYDDSFMSTSKSKQLSGNLSHFNNFDRKY